MDTVTTIQENAEDIYADAKQINEEREAAEEAVEDVAEETAEEAVEAEAEDTLRHKLYTATSDLRRIHTEKTKTPAEFSAGVFLGGIRFEILY